MSTVKDIKVKDSKGLTITLEPEEVQDTLGALNLVIKGLDATQLEVLERYAKLFKKLSIEPTV